MAGPARPSLDVEGTLDDDEWLEFFRVSLRRDGFWPRWAAVSGVAAAGIGAAALLGAPAWSTLGGAVVVLGTLGAYAAGYAWLGPRLRRRSASPADRPSRWRISAEHLIIDADGSPVDLAWRDVDTVVVTPRLVTFELTGGRGLLALPRRTATELGEALILGWAADERTPVTRLTRRTWRTRLTRRT